jgi:hypothetical protein
MTNRSADRWAPVGASRDILLCAPASARNHWSCVLAVTSFGLALGRWRIHPRPDASAKAGVHPPKRLSRRGEAPVYSVVLKLWNESRTNRARIADSLLVGFVHGNIS